MPAILPGVPTTPPGARANLPGTPTTSPGVRANRSCLQAKQSCCVGKPILFAGKAVLSCGQTGLVCRQSSLVVWANRSCLRAKQSCRVGKPVLFAGKAVLLCGQSSLVFPKYKLGFALKSPFRPENRLPNPPTGQETPAAPPIRWRRRSLRLLPLVPKLHLDTRLGSEVPLRREGVCCGWTNPPHPADAPPARSATSPGSAFPSATWERGKMRLLLTTATAPSPYLMNERYSQTPRTR